MTDSRGPEDAPDPRKGSGWKKVVGTLAGVFLGGVLLVAVLGMPGGLCAKVCDPEAFAEAIEVEKLDFTFPLVGWHFDPFSMAIFAIGLEAAVGFALLLGMRRLWVLIPASALVLFFMFLTGRAYLAYLGGADPGIASCGCFGNLADHTPTEAFWRDVALLIPASILMWLGRPKGAFPWRRTLVVVPLVIASVVFAIKAPGLPLDDAATRLHVGLDLKELCAGEGEDRFCLLGPEGAPEMEQGPYVVVIANLDDTFADLVKERLDELLEWQGREVYMPIYVLHSGKKGEEQAFAFRSGMPPLEYRPVPQALVRPLYRTLPRTFVVEDGRVTRTFSGFPLLAEIDSP